MKIPIVFLGTGQAIPTIRRNHTSILLNYKSEFLLFDCGEGTQRQFRKAKLNPCNLTRIFITHWHGDHILGLAGLLQTLALNGYNKTLIVYGPKGTSYFFNKIMDMFVFKGKIKYEIKEINEGKFFENRDFIIEANQMQHSANCLGYSFIEKDKIRINKEKLKKSGLKGKIIAEIAKGKDVIFNKKKIKAKDLIFEEKGRKITIILDTGMNNKAIDLAKNSDVLICESTYTSNEKELATDYEHLTATDAGKIAKQSNSKKLILTHISQRYDYKEKLLLTEAKKQFKNTSIAEDFMGIEV